MERRNYSKAYRVMHWLIAFCMLFLLFTIFLRLTWMNKENVADIIQDFLKEKSVTMDREELIVLAKQIRKPMWIWHSYAGYALSFLIAIRLILPFFGQMKFSNPFQKNLSLKNRFQYWVYLVFYVCVVLSLLTGLLMEFGPVNLEELMEEIHVLSLYYLIPFLVIHLGGVLMAEFTTHKGIISEIISGKRKSQDK
jgi:cytochrome b561